MGKEGGFTSHIGVLLYPMSRYHNTDAWAFLKPMLIIEHMKMMQMLYLDIRSMLLSGQVPHRTNSSQLLWIWLFQKKIKGVWGHTFLGKALKFLLLFSVPLEIPGKTKLHPWKFGIIMYVTSLRNSKAKKSRPLEILHDFCLVSLGISTLFLINPWKFCMLFYEYSWKLHVLTLPPSLFGFFLE